MAAGFEVFGGGEGIRPLDPPGICFICEANPDQTHTKIINTNRFFQPDRLSRLSGRKYICGDCATDLGNAVGLVKGADYDKALADLSESELRLEAAQNTIASYAALDEALKALAPKTKEVAKPKTKVA